MDRLPRMSLKALALMAIVAAVLVAGLLVMHAHGGGAVVDWLRSLHGAR
jgi:hypothetical protein